MKRVLRSIACLALATVLAGCMADGTLKVNFNWLPVDIADGWELSTPEAEGFARDDLQAAYELFFSEDDYVTAISLLVVRNGKLVAEGYCRDMEDRYVPEHTQSVTKSLTSLVLGITRGEGYFADLDATLFEFMPDPFDGTPVKREITLRHLLTMTSGIAFDNDDFSLELKMEQPSDPMAYILAKPMYDDPGDRFYYRDADPHLLAGAIRAETGETLEELAREHIFVPLGITDYVWEEDSGGTSFGPHGFFGRPRDMAKIGQLVLADGVWDEEQIVPAEWITQATSFQIQPEPNLAQFGYGFYWWTVPDLGAFTAWGHGGNFIFVVPAEELVIVFTAEPDADDDGVGTQLAEFLPLARVIIDAIER